MIDQNQQPAPVQPPAPQGDQGGATVCITASGDGSFMVYLKEGEQQGQSAPDIDAALDLAAQLLTGSAPDAGAKAASEAEELFTAGFNKTRGIPMGR